MTAALVVAPRRAGLEEVRGVAPPILRAWPGPKRETGDEEPPRKSCGRGPNTVVLVDGPCVNAQFSLPELRPLRIARPPGLPQREDCPGEYVYEVVPDTTDYPSRLDDGRVQYHLVQ